MSMNTGWRVERAGRLPVALLVLVLMAGSAVGGYWFGNRRAKHAAAAAPRTAASGAAVVSPQVPQGHPFTNDSFRIKVVGVHLHRRSLDARGGHAPIRPRNGQFVVVDVIAKNVSKKPAIMSATASTLVDARGRQYNAGVYLDASGQGIERYQQPGTTAHGWIAFDVPAAVHGVSAVIVQPDENLATKNVPTTVTIGG
ncbi:MAG TPA: DUF4352 domain-containing protein [Jatrophihabitantaceae bacterium]|jgi:hypothetical protein|nr:DUF4352 domain-containing protein [Jatrophihabitantaceae bacterium]